MSRDIPGGTVAEQARTRSRRRRRMRGIALAAILAFFGTLVVTQAASADEPPVPENVSAYFATGLIPRLAGLYGSAGNTDPGSTFDDTTQVGAIHRLLAWTPAFLAGEKTGSPTELTNTWVAPVTAKSGAILGLAAVWINPGSDLAELADFSRGRALVEALGRAPKDTQLIDDTVQQAWFATDGKTLTPLVTGTSGASGPLTIAEYQKILRAKAVAPKTEAAPANPGLLIAGITLGAVVILLAVFILLPARKGKGGSTVDAPSTPRRNPRGESERAFDRQASTMEARAISLARAAVSAEAGLVEAMAGSATAASEIAPLSVLPALAPDDEPSPTKAPAKRAPTPRKPAAEVPQKKSASSVAPAKSTAPRKAAPTATAKVAPTAAPRIASQARSMAAPTTTAKARSAAPVKKAAPKTPPNSAQQ